MSLLNSLLAFGALAFTVPLAIHLLYRSRFTTIDWGAMHLLDSVIRINRRRLQLMNLLLLLLRCAIPVLLAFCLARPVLTGFQTLPGDAPRSLVIVLDDSQSMLARDDSGNTRLEQAKRDLRGLIGDLSRRDEVLLIRGGELSRPVSAMGQQDALRRLGEIEAVSGPASVDRLLAAAVEAAADASHPDRTILVVSDFSSHLFDDKAMDRMAEIADALQRVRPSPVVSFLNYGIDSETLSNISVDAIEIDSATVIAGRGASFSARIRNASDRSAQNLRVIWSIDGQDLPGRGLNIEPRATATDRLTYRLEQPGVHLLTVAVEHADALAADNRRSIGVNVNDKLDVLLVDGEPSRKPLESETDFLSIALSPYAFGGEDLPDAVGTRVTTPAKLLESISAPRPEILVLANVKQLPPQTTALVSAFVLSGGSLVIFDGDRLDPGFYNRGWAGDSGPLFPPAQLGARSEAISDRDGDPLAVGELNRQYGPWQMLRQANERPFDDVDLYQHRKLDPVGAGSQADDTDELAPSMTLLRTLNGDPLVVSARRGRGQVVQFAIAADLADSNLPLRAAFLPMMQQLMLDLAGKQKRTTVDVGQPLAVGLEELGGSGGDAQPEERSESESTEAARYSVMTPDLREVSLTPNDQPLRQLTYLDTGRPGVYRFRRQTPDAESVAASTLRVVQVPSIESQLRDVEANRLASAAKMVGADVFSDPMSLQADDRTRRYGREIWRWLLIALLIGLIAELLLQQHSVRQTLRPGANG